MAVAFLIMVIAPIDMIGSIVAVCVCPEKRSREGFGSYNRRETRGAAIPAPCLLDIVTLSPHSCKHRPQTDSPTMTDLVSLRLDPDIRKRLDALAIATERSRAAIAAEAIKQYVDLQEWQIAAIKKGVEQADRGEFIDHARLKSKWEKRLAASMNMAR